MNGVDLSSMGQHQMPPQGRLTSCSDLCCFYQSLTCMPICVCKLPLVPCDAAITRHETIPHQRIKEFLQVSRNCFCLQVLHPMSRWESSKTSDRAQGRSHTTVPRCVYTSILLPVRFHQSLASSKPCWTPFITKQCWWMFSSDQPNSPAEFLLPRGRLLLPSCFLTTPYKGCTHHAPG